MIRGAFTKWLLVLIGVLWLFFVTLSYYIVHKPFTIENAVAILNVLGDVLLAVALFLLAAAFGRRVLSALNFASRLEAIVFQTGIGFGAISFATLGLGLLGLLNPILFWGLVLLSALLLRGDLVSLWHDLRAFRLPIDSQFDRALALFCCLSLVLAFILALLPPTGWDAQTYHLVEAKVAIAQGRVTTPPDIVYFSFPSLLEMIYLAAMLLGSDVVAQIIHFGFFLLVLGSVFEFATRHFGSRLGWLACALLVAVPSLVSVATAAYVDLGLAFYAFVALYAVIVARDGNDWRWFALAGVCAGLAMGVKYTSVIVPIALLVLLIRVRLTSVVVFLFSAVLFAAPWYLRNLSFTGNPVYPFVFGGPYWDAFRAEQFSRFGTGLLSTPLQLLTAPWDASILGREGAVSYDATVGPLLLILLPFAVVLLLGSRDRILRSVMIFSSILYLFWLVGLAESKLLLQTRLLFPAFPALAVAAALAFDRLGAFDLPQLSLQRFAKLLVLLVLGLTAFSYAMGFISENAFAYLVGFESRDHFLSQRLGGYYTTMQFINDSLPSTSKTLFLWEPRSYYARRAVQPDAILDAWGDARSRDKDADSIVAAWRRAGYTHVLVSRTGLDYLLQTGYDPISPEDMRVLEQVATLYLRQVYGKGLLLTTFRDGKPALSDVQQDQYAIYEIGPEVVP